MTGRLTSYGASLMRRWAFTHAWHWENNCNSCSLTKNIWLIHVLTFLLSLYPALPLYCFYTSPKSFSTLYMRTMKQLKMKPQMVPSIENLIYHATFITYYLLSKCVYWKAAFKKTHRPVTYKDTFSHVPMPPYCNWC